MVDLKDDLLTQRQNDVMNYLVAGYTNSAIAIQTGISNASVAVYITEIYHIYGASNSNGMNPRICSVIIFLRNSGMLRKTF